MNRPNILLLQAEDIGRHLGCYGDPFARTPHLDRLSEEGTRYENAFSHAPVCAPSRGGMVTGCYPWTIGNHHMRSNLLDPPRQFTHELVEAGYHVSWPTKLDFNFEPSDGWCTDTDAWWERDAPDGPFFLYRNFNQTHESRMFATVPAWHAPLPERAEELSFNVDELPVPEYLPDCPELRTQLVAYYRALAGIDELIGESLQLLEGQGQRENTIVIFLSDHGRGLPREKRWCYGAGIHLPLMVRWPGMAEAGSVGEDLVSWVDIAPTILSLAGVDIPEHYQGQPFLGDRAGSPREYVLSGRDRMDGVFDKVRAVRNKKWHYIRNDAPEIPWAQCQSYMEQQPVMPVVRQRYAEGKLTGPEGVFFAERKPPEELYDVHADPSMIHNLAGEPEFKECLMTMRRHLESHRKLYDDLGKITEEELVRRGLVGDRMEDYRSSSQSLSPDQQIGPEQSPISLAEYQQFVSG